MEKILTFIINKDNKLLLLLGSSNDPQFHKSFWYTVTGAKESIDDDLYSTVKREVKEETNLVVNKIVDLNTTFNYNSLGKKCTEHVFISYVDDNDIILNEESIDYKWCNLDKFVKTIYWHYDKKELYNLLSNYTMHKMKLHDEPFVKIKNGTKTIEMRLYDEKRKSIKINDIIEFTNIKNNEKIKCEVINLYHYNSFEELYKCFDNIFLGYEKDETTNYHDMEKYYSKEKQEKYGVLAIEIKKK